MVASPPTPILLPNQDQLPCDDGVPMETQRHKWQMDLLIEPLWTRFSEQSDGYVSGNMFVYFNAAQLRNQDFRGPDFFAVLGVPTRERKSWVVWDEGKGPHVVIELLSESTAEQDKTEKKRIYQEQLRVPEYFWYNPFNPEDWAGFALRDGVYQPLVREADQGFVSQQLGLRLILWQGPYRDLEIVWLRWATLDGEVLPTDKELSRRAQREADRVKQEANRVKQEAEQKVSEAERRAEQLAARLRAMGVDPEEI